ncbi:uncharacterized protein LOC9628916 [Selaginella moellendorffii]|nr:uncharacterized protein LOC9628916 [Selaginella moellendorffii]|eukprot:XP_002989092.2 uncharacterized protein LOC9628916 [Selaginella moellendorffii]
MNARARGGAMAFTSLALPTLVWILVAWLVALHFFTGWISSPSAATARSNRRKDRDNPVARLSDLLRYSELEEIEEIPVFSVRSSSGKKHKKSSKSAKSAISDDPLSELSPDRRLFYFPDRNLAAVDPSSSSEEERDIFFPGREWRDVDGLPIQAHGGGILYIPETRTFYWYGENKQGPTYRLHKKSSARVDLIGISCYSSQDLWRWKNEGLVLKADTTNTSSDLHTSNVAERPKVIFNDHTRQFVMYLHIDNANYSKASVGIATSSSPLGPFTYLGSTKPHGFDSRDMTIFKDEDDGSAFLVYSSQSNSELHISQLTPDYLGLSPAVSRALVNQHREAPAVFKHGNFFYMITSGCTGWWPNQALLHAAESMLGPWETLGDPCVGASDEFRLTTFFSQVAFVLPLPGLRDLFVFVADRWNPGNLSDSRYVWLPLTIDGRLDGPPEDDSFEFPMWSRVSVRWHRKWKLPEHWKNASLDDDEGEISL